MNQNTQSKKYDKTIYFDVDQGVTAIRRYGVYARSDTEAIEKVKSGAFDTEYFEVIEADEPYVIDADEGEVQMSKLNEPTYQEVMNAIADLPFPCYQGKDKDGVIEIHIPVKESEVQDA